jgi:hypothetical protein
MGPATLLRLGTFSLLAVTLAACTASVSYSPGSTEVCLTCGDDAGTGDAGLVSGGSMTPSANPILATIDDNVKMNASPGEGVGVFNQYASGGHWQIWWTCDTNLTNLNCPFDVKISSKSPITNATAQSFNKTDSLSTGGSAGNVGASDEGGSLEAKTVTTNGVQGVDFDTDPGATLTLSATVGGLYNGKFLFWVEDGKVNGGFKGTVTDPLLLVGASP